MAPRLPRVTGFSSNWRRPLTSIYNENYLFGFNFYDDLMVWLDKRDIGVDPGPVVTLPSVPETHFRKFITHGRDERSFRRDQENAIRKTQARIDKMAPRPHGLRSDREDLNRDEALRKTMSYSAYTSKAIADIDTTLTLQRNRPHSANAYYRKPLRTERDYDAWLKQIDRRRQRRLLEKEFEDEYLDTPRRYRNYDVDIARQREEIMLAEKLRRGGSQPRDLFTDRFAERLRQRSISPARDTFTSGYKRSISPARDTFTSGYSSSSDTKFRRSTYVRDSGFSSAPASRSGSPVRGLSIGMDEYLSGVDVGVWETKW